MPERCNASVPSYGYSAAACSSVCAHPGRGESSTAGLPALFRHGHARRVLQDRLQQCELGS
jgi:hypothetical protein